MLSYFTPVKGFENVASIRYKPTDANLLLLSLFQLHTQIKKNKSNSIHLLTTSAISTNQLE